MVDEPNDAAVKRLKAVKSAYIIEADALTARGVETAAAAMFIKAAEMELELAALFRSQSEQVYVQISQFSAGSCFFRARQYRRAAEQFEQVLAVFPEVCKLMAVCEGTDDFGLTRHPGTPCIDRLAGQEEGD
jgi:hypothetical protein